MLIARTGKFISLGKISFGAKVVNHFSLRAATRECKNLGPALIHSMPFTSGNPAKIVSTGACGFSKKKKNPIKGEVSSFDDCGDDSFCISETDKEIIMGVADGVGEWAEGGYNPGLFAQSLMRNIKEISETKLSESKADLRWLLKTAFTKIVEDSQLVDKKEQKPIGSSTVCVASIDKVNGSLNFANFGDSSMVIISRKSAQKPSSLRVAFKTEPQQSDFNCPYQMTLFPSGSSKFLDNKVECNKDPITLNSGDIVLLMTDGVLDNMFLKDLLKVVGVTLNSDSFKGASQQEKAKIIADEIAFKARQYSENSERESPFAIEAAKEGFIHNGGKKDDITVLTAIIS